VIGQFKPCEPRFRTLLIANFEGCDRERGLTGQVGFGSREINSLEIESTERFDSDEIRRMRSLNCEWRHQGSNRSPSPSSVRLSRPSTMSSTVPESEETVRSSGQSRSSLIRFIAGDFSPMSVSIELRKFLKSIR